MVCMRTGRPSSAGAAKLETAPAKVSEAPATTAGSATGSTMPNRMLRRLAPAICAASTRSELTVASAAAITVKASE
jgi:hypothetical protein